MAQTSQSIDQRMLAAQVAIDNALTGTEIKPLLAEYGYDETRLNEGKALLTALQDLHQKQIQEYGEQYAASDFLKTKWDEANSLYMKHVKVARVALQENRGSSQKLDLGGKRKVSLSGWLAQSNQFYINALADADILSKMNNFGITQAKLENGKQLVQEVEVANASQKKEKGEAQQATVDRDDALDKLNDWISDFIAIARIALEDRPQLLEKLGIVEPS